MLIQEIKLCEKYCKFKRSRDLTEKTIVCTFECRKMQITDSDIQETTKVNKEMQMYMFTLYKVKSVKPCNWLIYQMLENITLIS